MKTPEQTKEATSTAKAPTSHNPSAHDLTAGQTQILKILQRRQSQGKTSTSGNIADTWKRHRSQAYRELKVLMEKELVEFYGGKYYKIANQKEEENV